jgi:eukaryotic-like serine/threonine-protein kinase
LYVGNNNGDMLAIDRSTETVAWTYSTGSAIVGTPVFVNNTLYFGATDYNVYAVDAYTGEVLWLYFAGGPVVSSPAMGADGKLYVVAGFGDVIALEASTGTELWAYTIDTLENKAAQTSPSIGTDGTLYVASTNGSLIALWDGAPNVQFTGCAVPCDPAPWAQFMRDGTHSGKSPFVGPRTATLSNKAVLSPYRASSAVRMVVSPILSAYNLVYSATTDGFVYAWRQSSGAPVWNVSVSSPVYGSPALGTTGLLYVGGMDGVLSAVNALTGKIECGLPGAGDH